MTFEYFIWRKVPDSLSDRILIRFVEFYFMLAVSFAIANFTVILVNREFH